MKALRLLLAIMLVTISISTSISQERDGTKKEWVMENGPHICSHGNDNLVGCYPAIEAIGYEVQVSYDKHFTQIVPEWEAKRLYTRMLGFPHAGKPDWILVWHCVRYKDLGCIEPGKYWYRARVVYEDGISPWGRWSRKLIVR